MIQLWELNKKKLHVDGLVASNLLTLCNRLNKLRAIWGKPMIITSGLRSEDEQANLIKAGKSNAKKSKHLIGMAADILDPENKLDEWLEQNAKVLEEIGLWVERKDSTPGWTHLQCCPPNSGNRFFKP